MRYELDHLASTQQYPQRGMCIKGNESIRGGSNSLNQLQMATSASSLTWMTGELQLCILVGKKLIHHVLDRDYIGIVPPPHLEDQGSLTTKATPSRSGAVSSCDSCVDLRDGPRLAGCRRRDTTTPSSEGWWWTSCLHVSTELSQHGFLTSPKNQKWGWVTEMGVGYPVPSSISTSEPRHRC
jgi:hypothetical protein